MLRENGFVVGGVLLVGVAVLWAVLLATLGAGWWAFEAYLGAGLMAGFGGFFVYVGWAEGRSRREDLAAGELAGYAADGRR